MTFDTFCASLIGPGFGVAAAFHVSKMEVEPLSSQPLSGS